METKKWFDRKFDLNLGREKFITVYKRLQNAPARLQQIVAAAPGKMFIYRPGGAWSAKEHIGHLSVLEPLWRARIVDIRHGKSVLTPADINNTATSEGGFNDNDIPSLLDAFATERSKTLLLLDGLSVEDLDKTSLHPRLQQPMNMVAHIYFVAEHDDHHFARIQEIAGLAAC